MSMGGSTFRQTIRRSIEGGEEEAARVISFKPMIRPGKEEDDEDEDENDVEVYVG